MGAPRPRVYAIPAGVSFVDALARGLLAEAGDDPLRLTAMTVLLPNRRAARSLSEAFLRVGGGRATLLPSLRPLGDVDAEELTLAGEDFPLAAETLTLAPTMPPLMRRFRLAGLVAAQAERRGLTIGKAAVLAMAEELAQLLDEAETAEIDAEALAGLVPDRYAGHWQQSLLFLDIVFRAWPAAEAEGGMLGPARRRRLLLDAQARLWRRQPPAGPVIAAGSTGSIPAVARLLAVIAGLPQGSVVLPGLDRTLKGEQAAAVLGDPLHPQHGLLRLLQRLELTPPEVEPWPGTAPPAPRERLLQVALRPAEETLSWRGLAAGLRPAEKAAWAESLAGLRWLDCPGPREEAQAIALLLREALETPGRTAALVTPDRGLARRVTGELRRWGLEIDDSAGRPLADTPPATFLRHLAAAAVEGLAPLPLLSLLKHPLARLGAPAGALRQAVRRLEVAVLRGPRPAPGVAGLRASLAAAEAELRGDRKAEQRRALRALAPWLDRLEVALAPLQRALAARPCRLDVLFPALLTAAEALAAEAPAESAAAGGGDALWRGEAGEALAEAGREILAAAPDCPPFAAADWPALFEQLLAGRVVRPRWGRHPRLFLWGPLEARLQQADLMILGGLNEGSWPARVEPGAWLSRPMRAALGLPSVERRIGQAAHDVAQALAAPEVVLTRAMKVEGAPTLPARWLLRLEALTRALGLAGALRRESLAALGWAEQLDRPAQRIALPPPEPRPPLALRPTELSVTRIEKWMRNPYEIFARHILRLEALPAIDESLGAAERGTLVHRVLERFVQLYPDGPLPAGEAEAAMEGLIVEELQAAAVHPALPLLWGPRLRRRMAWFLAQERERRPELERVVVEQRGRLALEGLDFTLTAKADRLELRRDGTVVLVDYKTGQPPKSDDVVAGLSPQLPLEAAILADGGFAALGPRAAAGLEYWRLGGGAKAGEVKAVKGDAGDLAAEALAGLCRLVADFARESTAYHVWPRADVKPSFDDYRDLARIDEWSGGEAEP